MWMVQVKRFIPSLKILLGNLYVQTSARPYGHLYLLTIKQAVSFRKAQSLAK